jgi:23S rRNA (cytidine2498-2'-O)-methyltransferase
MESSTGVLISCDADSAAFALDEVRPLFDRLPPVTWLDDDLALLEGGMAFEAFARRLEARAPVFIRHIAPVQRRFALSGTTRDLERLCEEVRPLAAQIAPSRSFAVQSRILGDGPQPYRRVTVNETLSNLLQEMTGAALDTRTPEQVVSVLCTPELGTLGVSLAAQNRSLWPGGAHRFQREEDQVSRAEFKLLEAISLFDLKLPAQGTALDMGAAPGGWTRVLRQHGLQVVAVDPAEMDARLRVDRGVTRVRKLIQDYLPSAPRFEVIVNDMRIDARAAVEIMLQARPHLCPNGLAVLTLKLPEEIRAARHNPETVRAALERLSKHYRLVGARQLYHNRSEVTVALRA